MARHRLDFPRSRRQSRPSRRGGLEGLRADAAEVAVAAGSIVERLDVIEDIGAGQVACLVYALLDPFLFQAGEEGLGHRVVPAVAAAAHARL